MIQWTTPLMLSGLGLLALPLIAHWLNRRSRRRVVFPSIQFLQEATAAQNRWLLLRRWLLLLLRCLAVALLVLAFARPVWVSQHAPLAGDDSIAMAVVIDASLSTSQQQGGATAYQRMIAAAERSLNELTPGRDVATVIIARRQPESLLRKLSPNLDHLKRELANTRWSYERADLDAAIALASQQLRQHRSRNMLVVLSDLQQTNWQTSGTMAGESIELPRGTELRVVDLGWDPPGNSGLSEPAATPPDPLAGQRVQFSVRVANFSNEIRQVPVSLQAGSGTLDSQTLESQTVQIEPNRSVVAAFEFDYDPSWGREFMFRIADDALAVDNTAYLSLQAGRAAPLALITDDWPDQLGSSAFFLQRAVQPFADESDRFRVETLAPNQLEPRSLTPFDIAVVGYVHEWSEAAAAELIRFVQTGGMLLYFCGEGQVSAHLQQIEVQADEPVFPFLLSRLERWRNFDDALAITAGQWRGRWLREFDLQSQIALQQIRFPNAWAVAETRPDAEVLLSFSDQRPALAVRTLGTGQVLQANLSPSIEFSEFGKYGSFAALVQILARQLLDQAQDSTTRLVGDSLMFQSDQPGSDRSEFEVIDPAGEPAIARLVQAADTGIAGWIVDRATRPGFYQLRSGPEVVQSIAVNVDPRESDLRAFEPDRVASSFSTGQFAVASAGQFSIDLVDEGFPLWGWLMLIGLLALALESLLLGWWRR